MCNKCKTALILTAVISAIGTIVALLINRAITEKEWQEFSLDEDADEEYFFDD